MMDRHYLRRVVIWTNAETRRIMIRVTGGPNNSSSVAKKVTQYLIVNKAIRNRTIKNNTVEEIKIIPELVNPVNQTSLTSAD